MISNIIKKIMNNLATNFYDYGKNIMNDSSHSLVVGMRRFKSAFGVSPNVCSIVWLKIKNHLSPDFNEIHLLWTLFFLKTYNTEAINRSIFKCDEKTFRRRIWKIIDALSSLRVVSLHLTTM